MENKYILIITSYFLIGIIISQYIERKIHKHVKDTNGEPLPITNYMRFRMILMAPVYVDYSWVSSNPTMYYVPTNSFGWVIFICNS